MPPPASGLRNGRVGYLDVTTASLAAAPPGRRRLQAMQAEVKGRAGRGRALRGRAGGSEIDPNLVNALRIDERDREAPAADGARRRRWLVPTLLLLLVLGAAGAWWYAGRAPAVRVATAVGASAAGAAPVLQASGYVTARLQATVSAQITGTLTEVLIEEGDRVEKGQVIARLEDSGLRAALQVAEAGVRASAAQVVQAEAQLAQAEADARRQEELAASRMVSPQLAEQARTQAATAAAMLEARRREAEAARAQAAQARVNFDYTIVRAPFAGVVTVKAAQVGEIVSPLSAGGGFTRTGIGTIVDMDSLEVDVDVNEAYIGQVRREMPCEAVLDAYPDWKIPAHVIAIVPSADRGKATVKVRVGLDRKDERVVPEMGVRVSFLAAAPATTAAVASGVLVPAEALATRDGRTVVYVVDGGRVAERRVTPVPPDQGVRKRLAAGVAAGESVVLAPPASLRDGSAVRIDAAPR